MKNASHLSCIGCHREMSGPVDCNGCHKKSRDEKNARQGNGSVSTQAKPDFMHEGVKHPDKHRGVPVNKMGPVHFDHETHREFLDKCDMPIRPDQVYVPKHVIQLMVQNRVK
jgi:hypothetical protein